MALTDRERVSRFFAGTARRPTLLSGQVSRVAVDADTGQQVEATVLVAGGQQVRIPLSPAAPRLAGGDLVRLEQHGGPAAADYRLAEIAAGARPGSGVVPVYDPATIGGQGYGGGDLIVGRLGGGNTWIEYDTGNVHYRNGNEIYGADFATAPSINGVGYLPGSRLIGQASKAGDVYTPSGPWLLLGLEPGAARLKMGAGALTRLLLESDGSGYLANNRIRWNADGDVTLDDLFVGGDLVVSGLLKSANYAPGLAGWQIAGDGAAEFQNATIRGELRATTFVKGLIEAHAGTMEIGKSAGALALDYAVGGTLTVKTPPVGGWLFATGDILHINAQYSGGVGDTWVTVTRTGTVNQYTTTYQAGTAGVTYPAGTACVDWGQSGQGMLRMTADLTGAPYYEVLTHAGAPWATLARRARVGNLTGISGASGYGVWTDNGYFSGRVEGGAGNLVIDNTGLNCYGATHVNFYKGAQTNPYGGIWFSDRDYTNQFAMMWKQTGGGGIEHKVSLEAGGFHVTLQGLNGLHLTSTGLYTDGDFTYAGALKATRGAAAYTAYPIVPNGQVGNAAWDGDAKGVGTYVIDTSAWGYPAGIKLVQVRVSARWATASNSSVALVRTAGGSGAALVARAQVANVADDDTGWVVCDASGDIEIEIAGAATAATTLELGSYCI